MMTGNVISIKKLSPFLLLIILVAFFLSLSALYIAVDSFINQSEALDAYSFLAIGFGGLAFSTYMLLQTRGKPMHAVLVLPKVVTTLECPKCDFKNPDDSFYCGKCATPLKPHKDVSVTKTLRTPARIATRQTNTK